MQEKHFPEQFVSLLKILDGELTRQLVATETELIQVKKLMDDAIDVLVDSFISLEATARIGQNMLKQMVSDTPSSADELNPFREKQMQSAELLLETAAVMKELVKNATTHYNECEKLTGADKIDGLNRLQTLSKQISSEAKEVENKVEAIIHENAANIGMVADELSNINSQVEQDVQTAVQSLQFQDMTTQLIIHAAHKVQ